MKHLTELDRLEKIQEVAVPPFLFTRIEERIKQQEQNKQFVSLGWLYGASFAFALLLSCNIWLVGRFIQTTSNASQEVPSLVSTLNLDQSNQLYSSYE